jgi:hypothetical protein
MGPRTGLDAVTLLRLTTPTPPVVQFVVSRHTD